MKINNNKLDESLAALRKQLLELRTADGHWVGELSGSALSTATAVFALAMVDRQKHRALVRRGLDWLAANQNCDGGWGDTISSISNVSTTLLCWSALAIAEQAEIYERTVADTESWLVKRAGSLRPETLAEAVDAQYGRDRTFSTPILTMCALAGRLGRGEEAWELIKPLPFELAVFPHQLFRWLRLSVVSYALPALIAIGQVNFRHRRVTNPARRVLRQFTQRSTLELLRKIQPENGGFLEAAPLTGFVVMSLTDEDQAGDIVSRGVDFLQASVRRDGSWPIDTNLATWVTTLSVNALAADPDFKKNLSAVERTAVQRRLLSQQHYREHPYTHAAPGGWAWTDLPGAVPDADDTAGTLIALRNLDLGDRSVTGAAAAGIEWLLGLQNRDGGIATFCRGWNALPFDRSAPDLTAHAIAAMSAWLGLLSGPLRRRVDRAIRRALGYLKRVQRDDGSWTPLWFGNQNAPNQENPLYGTARVMTGLCALPPHYVPKITTVLGRAAEWLLSTQNADGGWGGARSVESSVEETALATDALAGLLSRVTEDSAFARLLNLRTEAAASSVSQGTSWLIRQINEVEMLTPTPIGLYFARLWYSERLYPLIFTLSALQKVRNLRAQ